MTSIWKKTRYILDNITLEPVVFLFGLSHGLYSITVQSLYISKVCAVNLNHSLTICDDIYQHEEIQTEVQKYVSQLQAYNFFLQGLPAVIYSLFAGPWSDINGRKAIIVLSCFGYVFNNVIYLLNTVFFFELKAEYLLFECLQDFTGGYVAFFFACHSYITDITDDSSRTKRMAFLDGIFPIGFLMGLGLSGIIKKKLGFTYCFSLAIVTSWSSILYTIFFIKERNSSEDQVDNTDDNSTTQSANNKVKKEPIWKMFKIQHFQAGVKSTLKRREHDLKKYLLFLILIFMLELFLYGGKGSVMFLYLRKRFKWTEIDFSQFMIVFGIQGLVSQYFVIPFLSHKLKWRDGTIILIAVGGNIIAGFMFAFANVSWLVYVAGIVSFLGAAISTLLRSLISKCIESDEIGKVFSVIASGQAVIFMIASPIYSLVYKATLDFFPGLVFLVTSCLYSIVGFLAIYLYFGLKKVENSRKNAHELREEELLNRN
ncbi:LOW QUALITY PROTEIN: probable peptidoglycan muropeptide transporter SLC46 [Lepeophtheirus salmonis]|uniref:LOW QUALITY PROTEIN: probable peptidoglycan muropeptide transporter SLC46 n=1 Tax=Lepeophtheirus salmonis TaxID=72036 RepID=UPI001AE64483|nr:LOW QUALITY PROTEIN: solute carrier family 46 member 3-like [Lepeophtheirus salmonis]